MMEAKTFCEVFDVSYGNLGAYRSTGLLPSKMFHKVGKSLYVHDNEFTRRHNFKSKVANYCHDMYYLLSEHFTDNDISRRATKLYGGSATSMATFIGDDLFARDTASYLMYKVGGRMWALFKFFRTVERELKRAYKDFDLQDALDRRISDVVVSDIKQRYPESKEMMPIKSELYGFDNAQDYYDYEETKRLAHMVGCADVGMVMSKVA